MDITGSNMRSIWTGGYPFQGKLNKLAVHDLKKKTKQELQWEIPSWYKLTVVLFGTDSETILLSYIQLLYPLTRFLPGIDQPGGYFSDS